MSSIFKPDKDWWNNARVNQGDIVSNKWEAYAMGYKIAAQTLVEKVLSRQSDVDYLVYPIIFLYRHYIELRLKEIIEHGSELLDLDNKIPTHHEIMTLWTAGGARGIVLEVWPDDSGDDLKAMEETLKEFARYDQVASTFRYPVDTKGNPSFDPEMRMINIRHFSERITKTVELLESITWGIAAYKDYKNDMMRDNMGY